MKYPTLDDPANVECLCLLHADRAQLIDSVGVDDGQIEIGACQNVQIKIDTVSGDGLYEVWKGEKYVVISIDMLNQMRVNQELKTYAEKEDRDQVIIHHVKQKEEDS